MAAEDPSDDPLATLEILDDQDIVVATLLLSNDEGHWRPTSTAEPTHAGAVDAIVASLATATATDDYPHRLVATLQNKGYKVRLLSQRITSTLKYDLRTGSVVGAATPIFHTADIDALGKRLLEHVADAIKVATGSQFTQLREQIAADEARALGNADVNFYTNEQKAQLLGLYRQANFSNFDRIDRFGALRRRLVLATDLCDYALASSDAQELMRDFSDELGQEDSIALQITPIIYAAFAGRAESAIVAFERLLALPNITADQRGWLWRNLSLTLKPEDPSAALAARHSIDAFLEAGKKADAGGSLMRQHMCLAVSDPTKAEGPLTELVELFPPSDLSARDYRAAALHERAQWRYSFGDKAGALADAKAAIDLRRTLIGRDNLLASSLFLAALAAKHLGTDEASAFESEAENLAARINAKLHELRSSAIELLRVYNAADAARIEGEARAMGHYDLAATAIMARASHDATLSLDERIALLEECASWPIDYLDMAMRHVIQNVIADLLRDSGYLNRAIPIYKMLSDATPVDWNRFANYMNALWSAGRWSEAANAAAHRIRMFGESPALQYAYGRSLCKAGDFSSAIGPLRAAQKAAPPGSAAHRFASELLNEAIDSGAAPRAVSTAEVSTPVTLPDVVQLLEDFSRTTSHSRGDYWRGGKWIERPEERAEIALHMFIEARFGDRVMALRQIRASGGIVDIFAQFLGLAVVFELKMCGGGYSSTYASEGEEQLRHYMPGRSNIGFLVVLDARLDGYGKSLLTPEKDDALTIREILIDVRPRQSKKKAKAEGRKPSAEIKGKKTARTRKRHRKKAWRTT